MDAKVKAKIKPSVKKAKKRFIKVLRKLDRKVFESPDVGDGEEGLANIVNGMAQALRVFVDQWDVAPAPMLKAFNDAFNQKK